MKIKCFICKKILEYEPSNEENAHIILPLYGGLWFRSRGNFGSTTFDPLPIASSSDECLQIAICDKCLMTKSDEVTYIRTRTHQQSVSQHKTWDPDKDIGIGH